MFDNYTEPAKKAVDVAREAAGAARRTTCGIEHLVLGLAAAAESAAAAVLEGLGVDEARLRGVLGAPAEGVARAVSFSPSALRAIEHGREAAARLGHDRIDTMHLLIGVLAAGEDEALASVGLSRAEAQARVAEVFGVQLPRARMHPDLREWIVERVRAEASQLRARIGEDLASRAVDMAGPSRGAADEPARRLVRRAIALRHGGEVLRLERESDLLRSDAPWGVLKRQAEALPAAAVDLTADDLARAAKELAS